MLGIGLALIACFGWGISSVLAGQKSRVMPVMTLLVASSMAGLGMFIISAGLRGMPLPRDPNLLYAVLGGASGIVGLYSFYHGLAIGAISIVVPISALCVLPPVLTGLAFGEILHPLQGIGIVVAVGGSIVVSLEKKPAEREKRLVAGIVPALGAASGFGGFYVVMDLAGAVDPLWAALVSRSSFFLFLLPLFLKERPTLKIKPAHLPVVFAIGILDAIAALAYTAATTKGMLSQVSVISSLYPAVAVILAAILLKERLQGLQYIGVILAIAGVALISGG